MLYVILVLGGITYVPTAIFALTELVRPVFIVESFALVWVAWIALDRRLSYRFRVLSLLGILYALGVAVLILIGPVSQIYLLAFPVLTGILLGLRSSVFALALNGATVFGIGFLADADLTLPGFVDTPLLNWFVIALNFMFIDTILTLSAAVLLQRLDALLTAQRMATASLKENERQLVAANAELTHEIAERERAEQETLRLTAEERHLFARLRQAEKLEALGTLAAGVAHDFNNVVGVILATAETARDQEGDRSRGHWDSIVTACDRARNVVRQMLTFSRATETERAPIKLDAVIAETIPLLRAAFEPKISIRHHLADAGYVRANGSEIQQILLNLATNAAEALIGSDSPVLTISLEKFVPEAAAAQPRAGLRAGVQYLKLTVADNGRGISAEIQSRMFDPFFTTKGLDVGSGLGLASVHGIVASLEGAIAVHSQPGQGATFEMFLPESAPPEKEPVREVAPKSIRALATARILVVDDEITLRRFASRFLAQLGHDVVEAENGVEAQKIFDRAPTEIDLVITDLTMPGVGGIELIQRMRAGRPDIPVILTTGFSSAHAMATLDSVGGVHFLQKPYTRQRLAEMVALALSKLPTPRRETG